MKTKVNAKQKREADEKKRKEHWAPKKDLPVRSAGVPAHQKPAVKRMEDYPQQSPEDDAREFLAYLERYGTPMQKDDAPQAGKRKSRQAAVIEKLNLEDGMPVVSDAVSNMQTGLQEMRAGGVKIVKLIHGYGSTGRGGKIRLGVRAELETMKRKKYIRDYIPGEDFGPLDAASRSLVERNRQISQDPDYGRINQGITIVIM